jgi:hypothetical protein
LLSAPLGSSVRSSGAEERSGAKRAGEPISFHFIQRRHKGEIDYPAAGDRFTQQALQLAQNATPPLL